MTLRHLCGLLVALSVYSVTAAAAEPPQKVYVPNPTGDVSAKIGSVIASDVSAVLMEHGIQAFTYANLAEQLKQEEYKEVLQCKADDRCVDEVAAGFGVATRVFTQVTMLGKDSYHLELSLETKGRLKNKVTRKSKVAEEALGGIASRMALELLGLKAGADDFEEEAIGVRAGDWNPAGSAKYIVDFRSTPPGAVVTVDGHLLCQDTSKGCRKMIAGGTHRVTMQKEKHVRRSESVAISADASVEWILEADVGWLTVTSAPPNLLVAINDENAGRTPVKHLEMAPGKYEVMVSGPCHHEQGRKIVLERGESEVVEVQPVPRQAAVNVSAVDENGNALRADVYVDGTKLGTAPGVHKVSICAKRIAVRKDAASWTGPVSVDEKQVVDVTAVLDIARAKAEATGNMVLIPAGKFMMGCNEEEDSDCGDDEEPYHDVYLDAYLIDKREVTAGDYMECVEDGPCDRLETTSKCNNPKYYRDRNDHPINCVDWYAAQAYCQWKGQRLPTEAEWEKAARGTDGRKYPWGNDWAGCHRAIMRAFGDDGCGFFTTSPVCTKSAGNTPNGICDMAGNVWEWVSDWYSAEVYDSDGRTNPTGAESGSEKVLRGGCWSSDPRFLGVSRRLKKAPDSSSEFRGFRCARSVD